jgi:hypothetical protein
MKKYLYAGIFVIGGLLFIFDPFDWWPIDDKVGKGRIPCQVEDTRPTCTGKIIFFWQ